MQAEARRGAMTSQSSSGLLVPFDAAARFSLTGRPGRIVQDVINISPDAIFVATAIGYGFEQDRMLDLSFLPVDSGNPPRVPGEITLGQFPLSALVEGFRINPEFGNVVFDRVGENGVTGDIGDFSNQQVSDDLLNRTFQLVRSMGDITFLFSMVDSSSGRELMDQPEFSLAGLGRSDGERPFRRLANPLTFLPRSTVRLQVIEQTANVIGTLFIVLYGYKILVGSACSEPSAGWLAEAAVRGSLLDLVGERAIPFDSVAKFELTGKSGNVIEDEIAVTTEGSFVVTSIGYGLAVESEDVLITRARVPGAPDQKDDTIIDLGSIPLNALPPTSLLDGIRIRPDYLRVALQSGGTLSSVPFVVADAVFERLNRADDVSFRYTIYDGGSGQAWQNVPLFNVAGLGIANGARPFKLLSRPALLSPRSELNLVVEETFGKGVLYIVLQGYKRIGAHGTGSSQ
jgi:hypothetical protein